MPLGLGSISKAEPYSRINETRGRAIIVPLDKDDSPMLNNGRGSNYGIALQHFPEAITDSWAPVYAAKDIPGGTLPLYQYIGNGERVLSFSTVFSTDLDLSDDDIAKGAEPYQNRNVDVKAAIAMLRSFMIPSYEGGMTYPPPRLLLYIPNSGIGAAAGSHVAGDDGIICIMKQCDPVVTDYFANNTPRIAQVALAFAQSAQYQKTVNYPRSDQKSKDYWYGTSRTRGYPSFISTKNARVGTVKV